MVTIGVGWINSWSLCTVYKTTSGWGGGNSWTFFGLRHSLVRELVNTAGVRDPSHFRIAFSGCNICISFPSYPFTLISCALVFNHCFPSHAFLSLAFQDLRCETVEIRILREIFKSQELDMVERLLCTVHFTYFEVKAHLNFTITF